MKKILVAIITGMFALTTVSVVAAEKKDEKKMEKKQAKTKSDKKKK